MISATRTRSTIDGVQFQATCFACGSDNARGLQLKFRVDPDGTATASLVPGSEWEGSRGIVHGGIVATLLDEAMAKAVAATGCKAMTAELRVRFRQYAETGEQLQVRGWVVKHKARLIETEALLEAAGGSERAHAWAKFLVVAKPQP
jgi:acyl-coenzyme A thioesterase PaaI-like protein